MVAFAATGRGAMGRKPVNGLEYLLWLPDALYKNQGKNRGKTIPSTTNQHCTATTNGKLVVTFFCLGREREREREYRFITFDE